MNEGWIKLHRKMVDWEWYTDANTFRLFMHLLITVNYKDKPWRGMVIKAGQRVAGRIALAEELGLTERQIRTSLTKLKTTNKIAIKTTSKFSVITLVKWEKYQAEDIEATSKTTSNESNERPTSDQQTTTSKECKERKKEKKEDIGAFPEWLPIDDWEGFCEMRKKIKKPLTARASKLLLKDLDDLRKSGNDPSEVLQKSIKQDWAGLFEIKKGYDNGKPKQKHSGFNEQNYSDGLDGFSTEPF